MTRITGKFAGGALASLLFIGLVGLADAAEPRDPAAILHDDAGGENWAAYGRTYGEQHFSPLAAVNRDNVKDLGLSWHMDLPLGNSVTGPLAVDGVIYFTSGYSVVHAVRAADGKLLWKYDPKVTEVAGRKLRQAYGSRGIAWWNGKIYTGAHDGRLIAIDAATGKELWSQMTVPQDDARFISGPPRVFDGKVIVGHGGGDVGSIRGYVTTYDAETGEFLWRFYTVPGNPADGFENPAMEMAAKTWAGEWWKHGGGGTVWNTITYDAETDTVFLGVGNGSPWNHRVRSAGEGDNLFLSSILALSGDGEYKWHYQTNPGESWDYNASMDMQLADLEIGGKLRKVLITAPKNGFFYVLDRVTGELISAEPFAKVTWAKGIDMKTGRPIENPDARYPEGTTFVMWPGPVGAHSWLPMAYSPKTRLAYIPAIELAAAYSSSGAAERNWKRFPGHAVDGATAVDFYVDAGPENGTSSLLAWDPVAQKEVWKVPTPGFFNGGVMATAGNLVFQGQADGLFNAYDAQTGERLWSFDAGVPVVAPPITFSHEGVQYVTVLTGMGTSGGAFAKFNPMPVDYYTQERRVLTFALGGKDSLPPPAPFVLEAVEDPEFTPDTTNLALGAEQFGRRCAVCHGVDAVASGQAPDLRASAIILSADSFAAVVRDGEFTPRGMPRFEELTDAELEAIRQYLRIRTAALRDKTAIAETKGKGER